MASPIIINPGPVGNDKTPATHGGFRDNVHLNAHDSMADEEGMGRDTLRRTAPYSDSDLLTEDKYNTVKNAWGARGSKENYRTSKWAKK